jgi:hypothetical protein
VYKLNGQCSFRDEQHNPLVVRALNANVILATGRLKRVVDQKGVLATKNVRVCYVIFL